MFVLQADKLSFSISDDGRAVEWCAPGLPLRQSDDADFWRAYLDDGYHREMRVRSSLQFFGRVQKTGPDALVVHYDRLVGDDGREFDMTLDVHMKVAVSTYPGLECYASVENRDAARLNEIQLPLIDLASGCDTDRSRDILYRMNGFGDTVPNPWTALKSYHTEYIAADDKQIWCALPYPSACSMAWFGLQTGGHFLYLGQQDTRYETLLLTAGVSPRGGEPQLILTMSQMPYAQTGEKLETMRSFVTLNEGDWRTGSDVYGNYARSHWYKPPVLPEWVKVMTGWQRIICRHQFGDIQFTYADLPRAYREGQKAGLNLLMVFGWWKGRFDNGYPVYEPDEELGGAEGLRAAIDEIHAMGGRVALYTNGQLIDVSTDFYRKTGYRICRIDIDGNEYRDHYRFGNAGTALRAFGYKSFVTACAGTPEWIELQMQHADLKFSFGADSAFYDQIGAFAPMPCFCEDHPHGKRAAAEEEGRLQCLKAIRTRCPEGRAIGTEMVTDRLMPYVHYVHGAQVGPIFTENACPSLYLRTFPETVHTDRFVHDDKPGVARLLNHAFIYGFRFDISPWRGRTDLSSMPRLTERVRKLVDLREQYKEFFYYGTFVCDTDVVLPQEVRKGEFLSADRTKRLLTFWNDTPNDIELRVGDRDVTIPAGDVSCTVIG
ncbi:MAG: hypothetical protein II710_07355 [Clostridia bacterium]|nr:hypothetical protein [Clostridia bacterium]